MGMEDFLFENMAPPRMPRKFVKPPQSHNEQDRPADDHELFLSAFEKPTQIYRYLETRHSESPIMLHRNLTYMMNYRMSRRKNTRNIGLHYIVEKLKKFHEESTAMLNLKFVGFFDENASVNLPPVEIGAHLVKKSQMKEEKRILVGKYKVPINPSKQSKNEHNEVSIFIDDFKKDENVCSCALQFSAKVHNAKSNTRYGRPTKLLKTTQEISSGEILIWTKQNFHLTEGLYDIAFEKNSNKENQAIAGNSQWKSLENHKEKIELKFSACLRLQLTLSGLKIKRKNTKLKKISHTPSEKPIIFQFLYGKFSQKTSASFIPNCPWCTVDCGSMYSLLKHLRLCHDRLCFKYTKTSKEHRISVILNEFFDGSYEGGPYEYSFSQSCLIPGPKRKYPCTKILVFGSKKPEPNLSEFSKFIEHEERPLVEGHHRLHYHSVTGTPIYPQELSEDSEEENDPLWLQQSVTKMVDAFRDVNDGEKEIMKMWNLHVLKNNYIGNCQMEVACNKFVEERGYDIITKNLYRNFVVHLTNLVDFDLITSSVLFQTVRKLQEKMRSCDADVLLKIVNVNSLKNGGNSVKINGESKKNEMDFSCTPRRNSRRKI